MLCLFGEQIKGSRAVNIWKLAGLQLKFLKCVVFTLRPKSAVQAEKVGFGIVSSSNDELDA